MSNSIYTTSNRQQHSLKNAKKTLSKRALQRITTTSLFMDPTLLFPRVHAKPTMLGPAWAKIFSQGCGRTRAQCKVSATLQLLSLICLPKFVLFVATSIKNCTFIIVVPNASKHSGKTPRPRTQSQRSCVLCPVSYVRPYRELVVTSLDQRHFSLASVGDRTSASVNPLTDSYPLTLKNTHLLAGCSTKKARTINRACTRDSPYQNINAEVHSGGYQRASQLLLASVGERTGLGSVGGRPENI